MDTSEVYVKMCEKAEEIQAWRSKTYLHKSAIEPVCHGLNGDFLWRKPSQTESLPLCIWLPRQDQLQEIVWSFIAGTYNLLPTKLFAFSDYWKENGIPTQFTSMEQLWLAFVMKKKYGKEWTGKEWESVKAEVGKWR